MQAEPTAPLVEPELVSQPPEPSYPSRGRMAQWLLVIGALAAVGWLLWAAWPVMAPFIVGLVLAYLLTPLVAWLARRMPRWLAILLVYLVGIALIVGVIAFLVPPVVRQSGQLIDNIPSEDELRRLFTAFEAWYLNTIPESFRVPLERAIAQSRQTFNANLTLYAQQVGTFLLSQVLQFFNILTFLVGFLIIPFWLFYVLNDSGRGAEMIDRMLHRRARADFWNGWKIIDGAFNSYIRGQLLLGAAVGAAVGIGLLIVELLGFDIKYILLLALFAGITELIPYIGPILGAIPAVLLALFSDRPLETTIAVVIVYIIVQQLENNLLVPRIMGDSVGVHPAILTVLLIAMGYVFGIFGVILAPPIAATARDLFLYTYRRFGGMAPLPAFLSVAQLLKPPGPPPAKKPPRLGKQ